jgi:hypothetical protein
MKLLLAITFITLFLIYIIVGLIIKLVTGKGKPLFNKNVRRTILYGRTIDAKLNPY